ncbi:hypothetical protein ACFQX6_11335 [Streptosporangium lutulentum]
MEDPEQTLDWLRENGFIVGDPPRARRPRHALSEALAEAADTLERLTHLMQNLDQRYESSEHYRSMGETVSILTSREEVTDTFDYLQGTVRHEWMQLITGPFLPLAGPLPPEQSTVPIGDLNCGGEWSTRRRSCRAPPSWRACATRCGGEGHRSGSLLTGCRRNCSSRMMSR